MSKRQSLMLIGVIIISFLFLGFDAFWDKTIAIFSGIIIIFISYRLAPEIVRTKKFNFVEHNNELANTTREEPAEITNEEKNNIS